MPWVQPLKKKEKEKGKKKKDLHQSKVKQEIRGKYTEKTFIKDF